MRRINKESIWPDTSKLPFWMAIASSIICLSIAIGIITMIVWRVTGKI